MRKLDADRSGKWGSKEESPMYSTGRFKSAGVLRFIDSISYDMIGKFGTTNEKGNRSTGLEYHKLHPHLQMEWCCREQAPEQRASLS